jgi:hypothetical protein
MVNPNPNVEGFLSTRRASLFLGVPAKWLRAEAKANRIPHLKAGRRLLFNISAVREALLSRTTGQDGGANVI